jgi:ABC-2 type transport system ATP-binding protein
MTPDPRDIAVRVEGLRKRFGATEALRGLSFAAEGPQLFGVFGPDGAGKTTLLRILAGLLEPDAGEVSVLGLEPRRHASALKHLVGYVRQDSSLDPALTVDENLRVVARRHGISRDEADARLSPLLDLAAPGGFRSAEVQTLSASRRQLVALCAALLPRPPLFLLDEPLLGLEPAARRCFWKVMREQARSALVILTTELVEEAARCDRMLFISDGRAATMRTSSNRREAGCSRGS